MDCKSLKIQRNLLVTFFFFYVSFTVWGQSNTEEISQYKKNKVKSEKVYEFDLKDKIAKSKGRLIIYDLFDSNGLNVESYYYLPEEFHDRFIYNEKGDLLEYLTLNQMDTMSTRYSYVYDLFDRMVEKRHNGYKWIYVYDKMGNHTKTQWFSNTQILYTDTFEFNDNNKMTRNIRMEPVDSVKYDIKYFYDSLDNLSKEVLYEYKNNRIIETKSFEYDSRGNCTSSQTLDEFNKVVAWDKIYYDETGLILREVVKGKPGDTIYLRTHEYEYYK